MERKVVSGIALTLFLTSMLSSTFGIALTVISHPSTYTDVNEKWINEPNAWDWDNSTYADETQLRVTNNIHWSGFDATDLGPINRVDLRIVITLTGLTNDYVTLKYYVGGVEGDPWTSITSSVTQQCFSLDNVTEPNDGSWSWADVGSLEIRQIGTQTKQRDPLAAYRTHEVWAVMYFGQPPVASFTYAPAHPYSGETVTFDASASYDSDGSIVSYVWHFGDGKNATEAEPITTHAYAAPGAYTVKLIVADNDGLVDIVAESFSVGKLNSTVSISASPTTITIGESTSISGSITPTRVGATVTIWYRLSGAETWSIITNVTTDENGQYSRDWIPYETGTYELKASWTGDDYTLPAESSIVTVCMKLSTFVSISTSTSSMYVGFRVNITGMLRDMYGNSLKNETVVLYYTFVGTMTWTPITSDTTDNLGNYFAVWIPPVIGYFVLKAEWTGNVTHCETSNTTTLSSLAYNNQYVFSVESNSAISGLAFNTTDWTLSFAATDTSGTRGYVKITVAKSFVANITDITVYLDGNQTGYSITSIDDSWLLNFTYTHSTHRVVVDLDVTITVDTTAPAILILFPENKTCTVNDVPLAFTISETTSWIGYSLDGQTDVTITGNTTLTSLLDGSHYVVVYANDTAGNMGASSTIYFTIDTTAPTIVIVSPKNDIYTSTSVSLTFTVYEPASWIGYSLDGQMNATISGNTTIVGLSDGVHTITAYANDAAGNTGASEIIYFTIKTQRAEPSQLWIVAVIAIIAGAGFALTLYMAYDLFTGHARARQFTKTYDAIRNSSNGRK